MLSLIIKFKLHFWAAIPIKILDTMSKVQAELKKTRRQQYPSYLLSTILYIYIIYIYIYIYIYYIFGFNPQNYSIETPPVSSFMLPTTNLFESSQYFHLGE